MVLTFLGALCLEFSKAQPNVTDNCTVKSIEDTYHFLCEAILSEPESSHCGVLGSFCSCVFQDRTIEGRAVRVILELESVGKAVVVFVQKDKQER